MADGQIVQIVSAVLIAITIACVALALIMAYVVTRGRRTGESNLEEARVVELEFMALNTDGMVETGARTPTEEEQQENNNEDDEEEEEQQLAKTCNLCGSECLPMCDATAAAAAGAAPSSDVADPRLMECHVRGEIFVTGVDVGFRCRCRPAASFFFHRGSGQQPPDHMERIRPSSLYTSIAALSGHTYRVWFCPAQHPPRSPACLRCRPVLSFELTRPGELTFQQCEAPAAADTVWIVAVDDEAAANRHRRVAYRGPLTSLGGLTYAGKLSLQFGTIDDNASLNEPSSTERNCSKESCDAPSEFNLSTDSVTVQVQFGGDGRLFVLEQVSGSNEYRDKDAGHVVLDDDDVSSSTMSTPTDGSAVAVTPRKVLSTKWAAIGLQEVASVIESSSSEEPVLSQDGDHRRREVLTLHSQSPACASSDDAATATAARAAAAARLDQEGGASDSSEYLKFMYSESSGDGGEGGGAGSTDDDSRPALSRRTVFYSAHSNSLVGSTDGASAIDSSQSDMPMD